MPTIRAAVALERQDPNQAIELLKAASTVELGGPTELAIYLCPVYVRGEAYLMLHSDLVSAVKRLERKLGFGRMKNFPKESKESAVADGIRAAAEFQKFIDHRGLVMNFPWGALARLGLARAYALEGDTVKARAAYEDFLTLWKDADPDIPILKEAKAEYARLQ
jgi:hypothetical protein